MLEILRAWVFPSACVACDVPGPALCVLCAPGAADAVAFAVDGVPAFALGAYEGPLRAAVIAMKHGARDPLDAFAALLRAAPVEGTLVPVPTTRRRAAERGFDQGVALARRLAAARGLPYAELLHKRGGPQAGRGRRDRLESNGRFSLRPVPLPPTVTLVDDVCTTGATLRDAARTLRAAGITVARIVVVARTPGTSEPATRS